MAEALDRLLADAVGQGVFPGAALQVRRGRDVVLERYVGLRRQGGAPVTPDTHYDLASVSKVMATTAVAMRLVAAGKLALEAPLARILPHLPPDKASLTPKHLLAHTSGLPAWRPLFEPLRARALAGDFAGARRSLLDSVAAEPLEAPPGSRCLYSDLGFLLLGEALEAAGGARLDHLWEREVRAPLALREAFYRDLAGPRPPLPFAATEACPWRGRVLEGEVHDDNTWVVGGVAGHAGLFATARAVGAFGSAMLEAAAGASTWMPRAVVETFWTRDPFGVGASYALGWDTPTPGASQAGARITDAVGHLGFTGTSLWLDRERGLVIVLLTNRVHPSRDDPRIREVRPRLHDAAVEAVAIGIGGDGSSVTPLPHHRTCGSASGGSEG